MWSCKRTLALGAAVLLLAPAPSPWAGATRPGHPPPPAAKQQSLTRYPGGSRALLIGNSQYGREWRQLAGVPADLERVRTALEHQGFEPEQIRVEKNLTSGEFLRVLREFAAPPRAAASDAPALRSRAVIYIAGHGAVRRDATSGKPIGYFVPVDAPNPDRNAREFNRLAIPVASIVADAVVSSDSEILYLLDVCFPGTSLVVAPLDLYGPQDSGKNGSRIRQVIAAGTDFQEVSDDGTFTARLSAGLDGFADLNSDGEITGRELGTYVRLQVADRFSGRQTPVFGNLIIPGSGIGNGDIVFASMRRGAMVGGRKVERAVGQVFRDCADCPEMVSQANDIAVGRFEVLFDEWDRCFAEGGCTRWLPDRGQGRRRMPAFGMTWLQANEFVRWLSQKTRQRYRLVGDSEWESLAGTAVTSFNCADCGTAWDGRPAPAGQLRGNEFGLHDMVGNLWELTNECVGNASPRHGAVRCDRVAVRGGAYSTRRSAISPRLSGLVGPTYADRNIGFRVARELR